MVDIVFTNVAALFIVRVDSRRRMYCLYTVSQTAIAVASVCMPADLQLPKLNARYLVRHSFKDNGEDSITRPRPSTNMH